MFNKKKYMKELDMRISTVDKISRKMKDADHGILQTHVLDDRTAREKAQDRNYIFQVLRKKAYALFNDDQEMSEEFLEILSQSHVTPEQFSIIYPQLQKNFKGEIIEPQEVMTNLYQLLENYEESGTVDGASTRGSVRGGNSTVASALSSMKSVISEAYSSKKLSKNDGDEMTDVLSVIEEEADGSDSSDSLSVQADNRVDQALSKLATILHSSSSGASTNKVSKRAQEDFQQLIHLLTSEKETSVDVILEQFVDIVQSIYDKSKDVHDEQASKITVAKLKEKMKEYGLKPGKKDKSTLMGELWQYEVDNDIDDGFFAGYDEFPFDA